MGQREHEGGGCECAGGNGACRKLQRPPARTGRGDRQAAVRPRVEFRTPLRQRQRRNRHGNLLRLGGAAAAVRIAAAVPPTLRPRPPAGGRGLVEPAPHADTPDRSEKRRLGKGCVSTCNTRWSPDLLQTKNKPRIITQ